MRVERPYHPKAMSESPVQPSAQHSGPEEADAFRRDVERLLALIRPGVREDGGDIELVSADPAGLVRIRFLGACVGCPSSHVTLHHGIERTLRSKLGDRVRVEAVPSTAGPTVGG